MVILKCDMCVAKVNVVDCSLANEYLVANKVISMVKRKVAVLALLLVHRVVRTSALSIDDDVNDVHKVLN